MKPSKFDKGLILIGILAISLLLSVNVQAYIQKQTQASLSFQTIIQEGSMLNDFSYLVFRVGSTYYLLNGKTGAIETQSTVASEIIIIALTHLTAGRTWKEKVILKGNFAISAPISIPSYTIFDASDATLTLSNNVNKQLLTNSDNVNGNDDIEIYVGLINGNADNQHNGNSTALAYDDTWFPNVPYGIRIEATNLASVCSNIIVKGRLTNTFRETIFLDNVENVVLDVTCENSKYYEGLAIRYGRHILGNVIAQNNTLNGVFLDTTGDTQLIATTSGNLHGFGTSWGIGNRITVTSFNNTENGVFVIENDDTTINAMSYYNGWDGLYCENDTGLTITGEYKNNTRQGIELARIFDSTITGCVIADNNVTGYYNATVFWHGLFATNSENIVVTGNKFIGANQYRALASWTGCDNWTIVGNDFTDGGINEPLVTGSNNCVGGNLGWSYITNEFFYQRLGYSYLIVTDGTYYYAIDGEGGEIVWSNTNASDVINSALSFLTYGRTWQEKVLLKGNFSIDSPLQVSGYTILELDGQVTLEDDSDCNIIENKNPSTNDPYVTIRGGLLNGNRAHNTVGNGIYWCHNTSDTSAREMVIEDLLIYDVAESGLNLTTPTQAEFGILDIHDCSIEHCTKYGLYMYYLYDFHVSNLLPVGGDINGIYLYGASTGLFEHFYANKGVHIVGGFYISLDDFHIDVGGSYPRDGLYMTYTEYSRFSHFSINAYGNGATTYDAIKLDDGCIHNQFETGYSGRQKGTGTFRWDYAIIEVGSSDYNTYVNVDGFDCPNGVLLLGANSHANLCWNSTSWLP